MGRIATLVYGILCYVVFIETFVYAIGWVGDFLVPRSMDSAPASPLVWALLIDTLLFGLFAVQHSLMARPAFKRMWTRIVPQPAERSTYTLFSSLALIVMFWAWKPIGGTIWNVENPIGTAVLYGLFAFGWVLCWCRSS